MRVIKVAMLMGVFSPMFVAAQQTCPNGVRVEGMVTDPTGSVIVGATVQTASGAMTLTDATGRFVFPCIPSGSATIVARAEGFAAATAREHARIGETAHLSLRLSVAAVQADVEVSANATALDADRGAGTVNLSSVYVQQLADDPDDFARQLQTLAASYGGDGAATITVDGFQNASALPPKGSIASIRINPDIFSPEFQSAPWTGGLIQVFTKPGANSFHGALFFTDSDGSFNATNPFSVTATPAGKRRYGLELNGPIARDKADFALALEKRDIDEFNVVNALGLDNSGNQIPLRETISAPQRLWIGSARGSWQVSPKDVATLSYSSNVNNRSNQGVGGRILPEAGYSSLVSEYDLRFTNTQPLNANLLHETRIGYTWKRTEQTPLSTTPSLQVPGYFTGGGATSQQLKDRERDLEVDDDVIATRGKHELKFGAQSFGIFVHDYDPNTFNGAYVFGGGTVAVLDANNNPTGQSTTINGIEQYRRALLDLSGGTPTTYQISGGVPLVPFTQWQLGFYGQDTIKLTPGFMIATGLRYQLQTSPSSFANFAPRLGISWSPDKKQTWVFHLRTGLFFAPTDQSYAAEVYRLNTLRQHQSTVYSPTYGDPLTPNGSSIQVTTINQFQPTIHQTSTFSINLNIEKDFPHHWSLHGWYLAGGESGRVRIRNINAPIVPSTVGTAPDPTAALMAPRPIATNENIMQYENSGHLSGTLFGLGLSQNSYKRFSFSASYKYENVKSDGGDTIASPQSSYSNQGEGSHVDWNKYNNFTFSGRVTLPYKVELATQFDAKDGERYNIMTGTDNNGDGIFNDRPSFTSISTSEAGVYSTRFGTLTSNTVNGSVPRNLGIMPGKIHLDLNVSRAITLNPHDKDHPRALTFNARSANLLNHTNVTAVNNVLSSSLGQSITAEAARRVELGTRFTF